MAGLDTIFKLAVVLNMVDNMTSPLGKATQAVENSVGKIEKLNQASMNLVKGGAAMAGAGWGITKAMLAPVEATFATQAALGELASLGVQDFGALEDAALKFSNAYSGTTKAEFLSAAYDIKSGIASLTDAGVADYTTLAALTAKATKSTVGEMTNLFATGYGIYKGFYDDLSDQQFGQIFSAGISKSVQQFKTTGSGMAQAIQALGGSATTANVPLEEQLAILGMLQATMSGSEAGTKYRAILRSAAKAGEDLGLSFMDANNQLRSMPEILGQLQSKYGTTLDAMEKRQIQTAFGSDEAAAVIDLLYAKTGELQDNIIGLYDGMGDGIGLSKQMADAINGTDSSAWALAGQRIANIKEQLGTSLLPTINAVLDKAEPLFDQVAAFIDAHPKLVTAIMGGALALGAIVTVAGTAAIAIGGVGLLAGTAAKGVLKILGVGEAVKSGFTTLRIVAMYAGDGIGFLLGKGKLLLAGIPKLIGVAKGALALFAANPMAIATAGISALVVAGMALYKNWDTVKAKALELGDAIVGLPGKIKDGFTNAFPGVTRTLTAGLDKIKGLLPHSDAKTGPLSHLTASGEATMTTFAAGVANKADAPAREVARALRRPSLDAKWELPTYDLPARIETARTERETRTTDRRGVSVGRLTINADLSKIEDLQKLRRLLEELDDMKPEGAPEPA